MHDRRGLKTASTGSPVAPKLHSIPHGHAELQTGCSAQAVYDWWQYRLCDVFIELVKPVMQRGDEDAADQADKTAFRNTLWTCLDVGLRWATLASEGLACRCKRSMF